MLATAMKAVEKLARFAAALARDHELVRGRESKATLFIVVRKPQSPGGAAGHGGKISRLDRELPVE